MRFVTYTATPGLEAVPEPERSRIWSATHKRLMRTHGDYRRRVRGTLWSVIAANLGFLALCLVFGRIQWPPLIIQLPCFFVLAAVYVYYLLAASFRAQQFQNEQVGRALKEQAV